MLSHSVIDSSLPPSSAAFTQQACNQKAHTIDVINSGWLHSSFISISLVSAHKREGKEETVVRMDRLMNSENKDK